MIDKECCLIVLFRKKIELAWIKCESFPLSSFRYQGSLYQGQINEGFNGFYDWLRTSDGKLIGVTYFGNNDLGILTATFRQFSCVTVQNAIDGSPIFNIFFSSNRIFDEKSSDDQDFGYNWLFNTDSGEFALSFNANNILKFLTNIEQIKQLS